jgi:Na+-transporting NADH:ubiquinone oxidoreductase subunit NqrB
MPEPTTAAASTPPAGPSAPTAVPAPKKLKFDPRYIAPLLVTAVLVTGQISYHVLSSVPELLLSIGAAMITETVLGLLHYRKIPHLASAYVSGISVAIILRQPEAWPLAACAAISIASKYVLRFHGRHLWNPSNFGISAVLLLAPNIVAPLSVQFGNSIWAIAVIWTLGIFILSRLKRLHICVAYALSFAFFTAVRSAISGQPFVTEFTPLTGPPYQLFIMFMITDPKSTVHPKWAQCLVVFLIAAVECVFRLSHNVMIAGYPLMLDIHAPYFALFLVGPLANLVEIMAAKKKGLPIPGAPKVGGPPKAKPATA